MSELLQTTMSYQIQMIENEELWLLPERAVYWKKENALLIADLHLGKSTHFRKTGVAMPSDLLQTDIRALRRLIWNYQPEKIFFLGDLFHSDYNAEWDIFLSFLYEYSFIEFHLIKGNHDILDQKIIDNTSLIFHDKEFKLDPFIFSHIPSKADTENYYISGHLHPSVSLSGKGRQNINLPCFYFGKNQAVLPAFGRFTGNATINPEDDELVFVIAEGRVMKV